MTVMFLLLAVRRKKKGDFITDADWSPGVGSGERPAHAAHIMIAPRILAAFHSQDGGWPSIRKDCIIRMGYSG
jgi:hypothetical protein